MEYFLIRGVVRNLHIIAGFQDLNPHTELKDAVSTAGIIAAIVESSTSSSLLMNSRDSAETRMENFKCFIGDKELIGDFYKVGFCDGEEMEFVAEKFDDFYGVHAACSISQKLIWTMPYRTRGTSAQKRHDIIGSLTVSFIATALLFVVANFLSSAESVHKWKNSRDFATLGFFIVFILNVCVRRSFFKFSSEATKIFEVFGFFDPENVNLPRTNKQAEKRYCREKNVPKSYAVPWQFRYETVDADK